MYAAAYSDQCNPSNFNYETTIASIRAFLKSSKLPIGKKRIYMILDNAPWHKKAKRLIRDEKLPEYQDIRDAVEFLDIPPYSPDLNPIEQLWRITRKDVTHNRYFASLDLLSAALTSFFNRFKEANAKIASLCTFKFIDSEHSTGKKHVVIGSGYITLPD